ncbi:MAG: hypothetical protein ABFR62_02345 [Bacteroidota bacterium]
MLSIRNIVFLFGVLSLVSCVLGKEENELIETKTSLSSIEISNYLPNSRNSISNGYTKLSYSLIGTKNAANLEENFGQGDLNNKELYFDSSNYNFLKNIPKTTLLTTELVESIIRKNISRFNTGYTELENEKMELAGVISRLERDLMITLEVPENKTLNWSVVKIWTMDKENSRPQIHSVLFAKANNFSSIGLIKNNVMLKDGDFVYRLVLNDELQFHKDMNIYVSVNMDELLD